MNVEKEIAQLAFEIYEINGKQEGRDLANWLEAERIILSAHRTEEILPTETNEIDKQDVSKLDPFSQAETEQVVV
jgi:DUF2934 family protein